MGPIAVLHQWQFCHVLSPQEMSVVSPVVGVSLWWVSKECPLGMFTAFDHLALWFKGVPCITASRVRYPAVVIQQQAAPTNVWLCVRKRACRAGVFVPAQAYGRCTPSSMMPRCVQIQVPVSGISIDSTATTTSSACLTASSPRTCVRLLVTHSLLSPRTVCVTSCGSLNGSSGCSSYGSCQSLFAFGASPAPCFQHS